MSAARSSARRPSKPRRGRGSVPRGRGHPELAPRNYWRGPVWANVTWLSAHALSLHGEQRAAAELRRRMLRAIEGGGMREYFEADSGRGLGARDFAWTAALALRELADALAAEDASRSLAPSHRSVSSPCSIPWP